MAKCIHIINKKNGIKEQCTTNVVAESNYCKKHTKNMVVVIKCNHIIHKKDGTEKQCTSKTIVGSETCKRHTKMEKIVKEPVVVDTLKPEPVEPVVESEPIGEKDTKMVTKVKKTCMHEMTRGKKKGQLCGTWIKNPNEDACSKHNSNALDNYIFKKITKLIIDMYKIIDYEGHIYLNEDEDVNKFDVVFDWPNIYLKSKKQEMHYPSKMTKWLNTIPNETLKKYEEQYDGVEY